MSSNANRRAEQRLSYHWPIWFGENFDGELSQGQMADVSSNAASFTCYTHERCPDLGQSITARFSVPHYGPDGAFDMADFVRSGNVCRVDNINGQIRRIAVRFAEPLPFKPGEQLVTPEYHDLQENLEPALV